MRLCIAGGPKTGKTTLAATLGIPVKHTDDALDLGWSEASAEVASWMSMPGPWVIEGVAVPRAIRKFLAANPGKPCDKVIWLDMPRVDTTPAQDTMAKGALTVMAQILPELHARGVAFEVL